MIIENEFSLEGITFQSMEYEKKEIKILFLSFMYVCGFKRADGIMDCHK